MGGGGLDFGVVRSCQSTCLCWKFDPESLFWSLENQRFDTLHMCVNSVSAALDVEINWLLSSVIGKIRLDCLYKLHTIASVVDTGNFVLND